MMINRIAKPLWLLGALGIFFTGSLLLSRFSRSGGLVTGGDRPAQAEAAGAFSQFLPVVAGRFPFPTVFGVEMTTIDTAHGLEKLSEVRSHWVRRNNAVLWADLQPDSGVPPDWSLLSGLETELQDAARANMPVILVVRSAPAWAQQIPGIPCGPIRADAFDAFASFMKELVTRYSKAPYRVKHWEIWNEPDVAPGELEDATDLGNPYGCWGDPEDPYFGGGYYGDLLSVVYPAIKAADPQARVLLGGLLLYCNPDLPALCTGPNGELPLKFLEGVLIRNGANDGGDYFDGVSFHAYDFDGPGAGRYANTTWGTAYNANGPVSLAKTRFIRDVLAAHGVTGKFLMNTESALICIDLCFPDFETTKAYYVPQVYAASIADGLAGNLWFTAVTGWRGSSLINADLTPRPAFTAYAFARAEIGGATFSREITEYFNVKGYELDRGDRRIWVIRSQNGTPHDITLPGTPLAIWDALGNAQPVTADSLTLTIQPLYVEWSP